MEIFTLLIYCSVCHHIHHYTVYPIIQSRWPSHMRLLYYIPKIWLVQSKNTLNFEVLVKNCSVSTFCWNDNTLLCVCAYLLSCIWHFANFLDCSPLGSSVHGIFQARILKWVAISSSWGSSCWTCICPASNPVTWGFHLQPRIPSRQLFSPTNFKQIL